jgi:acyl-CoA reductase-like NAD-dependent aldehyde dehydrogenase
MTKNYIAGDWVAASEASLNINPSNTGDVIGEFARASAAEAEAAISAAYEAFPAWSRSSIQTRHDILKAVGDERDAPGFYLAPALFTEVNNRMRVAQEEIFGPVATVIRAKDYDEALEIANDTPFGLSSGICTTSLKHATHFKRNAEADMVMVNLPTAGVDYHVPFGGRKGSSYGPREQGRYAQEFYTTVKTAYTFDGNGPYVPKTKSSE